MTKDMTIVEEIPQLYRVIPLRCLRRTEGVHFDNVPLKAFEHIDALDRVIHGGGAVSPGAVGNVARPWYMHPYQADNLIVLHGTRYVDIYTPDHGKVESFVVTADKVEHNGRLVYEGAAMLVWPCYVFHRILSDSVTGSASLNFAVHYDGFNISDNFNIYDLDTKTGTYKVIREGHKDQPGGDCGGS